MCNKKDRPPSSFGRYNLLKLTHLIIATSSIKEKFVPSVYASFDRNRKHSFDGILEITKLVYFRVFSRDVTAAMLMSLNTGTAAFLVSPTNPPGIELYSYANVFFCFG